MKTKRVLITSPSLIFKDNVSGISSLVADIMTYSEFNFLHFQLGSKDGIKKNIKWAVSLFNTYLRIILISIFKRYEIVHLNVALERSSIIRDSLFFFIVKKCFSKKVILHIHGGYFLTHSPQSRLLIFLLKKNFKNAKKIIVLSDLEKGILTRRYGTFSFNVLPNAVNTFSTNGPIQRSANEGIKFIFMGRVVETKGIYTITESLKYLTNYFDRFSLEIFGAGPELDKWIASLNEYKGLKFSYHGVVGGNDKWDALKKSHVFLLPSYFEGMPIAMIEAMAAGCVVIVSDVGSIKTLIVNNSNGILLPGRSAIQLAEKMEEIILDKVDLKAIGLRAKKYVEANLSFSNYIQKLEDIYSTL